MADDLKLLEFGNGGELILAGNQLVMTDSVSNKIYLAMFSNSSGDWWGNDLFNPILSETEKTLKLVTLNSAGKIRVENAIKKDLEFLGNDYRLTTKIVALNRIDINIEVNGNTYKFEYQKGEGIISRIPPPLPTTYPIRLIIQNNKSTAYNFDQFGTIYYSNDSLSIPPNSEVTIYTGVVLSSYDPSLLIGTGSFELARVKWLSSESNIISYTELDNFTMFFGNHFITLPPIPTTPGMYIILKALIAAHYGTLTFIAENNDTIEHTMSFAFPAYFSTRVLTLAAGSSRTELTVDIDTTTIDANATFSNTSGIDVHFALSFSNDNGDTWVTMIDTTYPNGASGNTTGYGALTAGEFNIIKIEYLP